MTALNIFENHLMLSYCLSKIKLQKIVDSTQKQIKRQPFKKHYNDISFNHNYNKII
ncbi:hypothetical protein WVI01_12540 [Weissella viridescens]|uniref:Uncharacterized protein n=1 Tax=Weissella viridescens TaxID=1629 RepID=A0A0R2H9J0_WEIVI|nr:hypothetical protein IV50_GL000479 [Weissella viridescens]GEA95331.1 hypothetical protein WVI01_12540 [Weissella viridescens]